MNNNEIMKYFTSEDNNFFPINIETDLKINDEEIKQIYMINNTTSNYTYNEEIIIISANISKKKKKKKNGRKKKNVAINNDNETKRDKFAKDNIARKIKTKFYNKFLVDLLNIKIKSVFGKQIYLVRKFNKALVKDVSIQFNLDLFNSKIRNLLNQEISNKYKTVGLDANKRILNILKNVPDFNEFLNYSAKDIYSLFINDNYKEIISNVFNIDKKEIYFENLAGIIEELREQGYEEEYLEKFKYFAYNINELFDKSKKRKPKNKKKIII